MEIIEWVALLKNHLLNSLNHSQTSLLTSNAIVAAGYCFTLTLRVNASRALCLLAFFVCLSVSYTPLYESLSNVQYYSVFVMIYTILTYKVRPLKTKSAVSIMVAACLVMTWDRFTNAGIQTFIYDSYSGVILFVHALIIGSFIERDVNLIKSHLDRFTAGLRNVFGYTCNHARMWYYYANTVYKSCKR